MAAEIARTLTRSVTNCGFSHSSASDRKVQARSSSASPNTAPKYAPVKAELSSFFGVSVQIPTRKFHSRVVRSNRSAPVASSSEPEVYVVELEKPIGLKFYKGEDAGTYVDYIIPGQNAEATGKFQPGDKVLETSAVFGDEMWPAAEFGRTMYSVRQRAGILTLKMEKKYGKKIAPFKAKEAYIVERNSGNYGDALREKQLENYTKKKELKAQRSIEIEEGLKLYKKGDFTEALIRFETVLELQPEDRETRVTYYNIACCYSKLDKVSDGLKALEAAMEFGFEDYKAIRSDPDLAKVRESEDFYTLIDRYDEPFINENAINAIKNVFGFLGGKK